VYNVEDANSYLAKMRQGAGGAWLFHLPYTPEEHPGAFLLLFYLLLGKGAALTGLSMAWTYNLARVACGAILLVAIYVFCARWCAAVAVRRAAFLLAAFGSGFGWLLTLLGRPAWLGMLALDLILPEAYAFLSLYAPPHIALATACLLLGALAVHRARRAGAGSLAAGAALLTAAALIGAFYLLVPFAVLGVDWLVTALRQKRPDWRQAGRIALAGIGPGLLILYNLYVFNSHPVYRGWAAQNDVRSPHPAHYLAAYALVGLLAIGGVVWAARRRQWERLQLPVVWVALAPVLVYLPFAMQRRLIVGAQVPLCLLAALGLIHGLVLPFGRSRLVRRLSAHPRYSRRGMRRLLVAAVVLAATPTNLLLLLGNSLEVSRTAPPIFYSAAEIEVLDWLGANSSSQDTVLCAYETGNRVPARAGNRVVLGLGPETINADQKRREVARFFDADTSHEWRRELLARYNVAYVLIGPPERALGGFDPSAAPYLREAYRAASGEVVLYRVETGSPSARDRNRGSL